MFFYIGTECPVGGLECHNPNLYLDKGWQQLSFPNCLVWYKGYSTECNISDRMYDIVVNNYNPAGKWCAITLKVGANYNIIHPHFRGFPLYKQDDILTNIKLDGFETVLYPELPITDNSPLTLSEASSIVGDILVENTINFLEYNKISQMNVLCSAGLDTITSWAVFDSVTKDYTLHAYIPKDADTDLHSYVGRIREYQSELLDKVSNDFWGYDVSSAYNDLNWYLTGYYAETIQFRDGEAINILANHQGKKIHELPDENHYLYWFLQRPNIIEKYKDSMLSFNSEQELKDSLWHTIFYDHQMWHIDNNMTFSPFADIRIPQTIYRMSVEDITINSTTGIIQRNIINRFRPDFLSLVSDYKNSKDIWKNFRENFSSIVLDPSVKINLR